MGRGRGNKEYFKSGLRALVNDHCSANALSFSGLRKWAKLFGQNCPEYPEQWNGQSGAMGSWSIADVMMPGMLNKLFVCLNVWFKGRMNTFVSKMAASLFPGCFTSDSMLLEELMEIFSLRLLKR